MITASVSIYETYLWMIKAYLAVCEPLEKTSTWPQIWRIACQEVAPQTPHPVISEKLRGGLTTGSLIFLMLSETEKEATPLLIVF